MKPLKGYRKATEIERQRIEKRLIAKGFMSVRRYKPKKDSPPPVGHIEYFVKK